MIVLIAISERLVITDNLNPNPITGRQSIFDKSKANGEMKPVVEIVGVYSKLEDANNARARHAQGHPARRYLQKVCHLNDERVQPLEPPKCIKCGTPIGPIGSFCPPCQKQHYAECVALDPRGGEGDIVPVRQSDFGPTSTLLNTGG